MDIIIIIPAHLASIRLGRKMLIDIDGLPMIEHVRRRAMLSKSVKEVYIATGDKEIKNVIEFNGGKVIPTKKNHKNGTYRIAEAISCMDCSHVILVQGDEPLLIPNYIDIFARQMMKTRSEKMWNGVTRFDEMNNIDEHSLVKCIIDSNNHIISFFRKTPIFSEFTNFKNILFKIQGLIAYECNFLNELVNLNDTPFAKLESIEQMKAIEHGYKIKAIELPKNFPSVNTENELAIVKEILNKNLDQKKIFKKIIKR